MHNIGLLGYGETSEFALKSLIKKFKIDWIITPPIDSPLHLSAKSVEALAKNHKIKIIRTNSENAIYKAIKKTEPVAVVISSYNRVLSENILAISNFINVHHGKLPKYRGRANINWAIINGEKNIGLSIHEATSQLDSGNIYAQYNVPIALNDTVRNVYDKFNKLIEKDLARVVLKVILGLKGRAQKGTVSYCCTRIAQDGYINWNWSSKQIYNFVRALTKPFPGAFTYYDKKKIIIWDAQLPNKKNKYEGRIPGRIIRIDKTQGVEVLTGDSSIIIKKIGYKDQEISPYELIKSVKKSLGINIIKLFEDFYKIKS